MTGTDVLAGASRSRWHPVAGPVTGAAAPGSVSALEQAPDERSLPGVLKIVGQHAHEAHGHRHRRVERPVDNFSKSVSVRPWTNETVCS